MSIVLDILSVACDISVEAGDWVSRNWQRPNMLRNLDRVSRIVFYAGFAVVTAIAAMPSVAILIHLAGFPATAEVIGVFFFSLITATA